ncbi:MAG: TonB family protein [Myxococcaceae bacterium]
MTPPRLLLCVVFLWGSLARADIVAPTVVDSPAAIYPAGSTLQASVVTRVTVDADGKVTEAEVVQSGGPAFDAAALEAVKRWTFHPALRDGAPVPARIRIPFRFEPPSPPPPSADAGPPPISSGAPGPGHPVVVPLPAPPPGPPSPAEPESIEDVTVRGTRHQDFGTGDFQIELGELASTVGATAAKALELAPGIVIGDEGGLGHAQQIILRGFNADQGTAVEMTFNGIPINQVSNTDAQGYADLNFLIPEVVREVVVLEGPYDPRQGDFAAAGSADFELGVLERGTRLQFTYGSFGTARFLGIIAPNEERTGTFLAFSYVTTNGYGANRSGTAVSAMGQYEGTLGAKGLWHLLATGYAVQNQSAGAVRQDDVQAGLVPFYGTYDTLLGGNAQTFNLGGDIEVPAAGGVFKLQAFLSWKTLRILENFEGIFLVNPPETPPGVVGEGIQQSYTAMTVGSRGSYRMAGDWLGREQSLEIGTYARYDHATPIVSRLLEGTTTPYALENDTIADVVNLAAYVDIDFRPTDWFRLRGGFREDYFNYDVLFNCNELSGADVPGTPLANICTSPNNQPVLVPERESTAAGIFEPRVTALAQVTPSVTLSVSYGVGAQSLDAQYVGQPHVSPFSEQHAVEGGVLYKRRFGTMELTARAVGFYSILSSSYLFNPDLGYAQLTAGSTRVGFVADSRATGTWFDILGSVTYADATQNDTGQLTPLVPAWVARLFGAVYGPVPGITIDGAPVVGKLSAKASYLGSRPIGDGFRSPATFTLDADATLRWRMVELGFRVENITNLEYALTPFYGNANFPVGNLTAPRNPLLAYTFTAAPPRALFVTLALIFGGP